MSSALLISDLHLTSNPRDAYRWKLFDWLYGNLQSVSELFILGDLTDAKDYHSAKLVNRVVNELVRIKKKVKTIYVLRGNHDGVDPLCPYFQFLAQVPGIVYVASALQTTIYGDRPNREYPNVVMLPHTTDPVNNWQLMDLHKADFVFMHATVQGSLAENGQALDGIPPSLLATVKRGRIFSGDIHVPQKVGKVEYVGAQYPIRFGDKFKPRAILLEDWRNVISIPVPGIRRLAITVDVDGSASDMPKKGDQVKIKARLTPSEFGQFQRLKQETVAAYESMGVQVFAFELERLGDAGSVPTLKRKGIAPRTPEAVLREWCKGNKTGEQLRDVGLEILKGVK